MPIRKPASKFSKSTTEHHGYRLELVLECIAKLAQVVFINLLEAGAVGGGEIGLIRLALALPAMGNF